MTNIATIHDDLTTADVGPFASWMMNRSRQKDPVSIAIRSRAKKLALGNRDEAWVIDLKNEISALFLGVIDTHCVSTPVISLQARNLPFDLVNLTRLLAQRLDKPLREVFTSLAACFQGDLTSAGHCVNFPVSPATKYRRIEHDTFEISLNLPQYEHMIADYYSRIGVPLGKIMAEGALFKPKKDFDWWVTYHHLWVRALASLTGDPSLMQGLNDDRDPFEVVAEATGLSKDEAEIGLLYHACGRDLNVLRNRFPKRLRELPAEHGRIDHAFDVGMPALVSACASAMRAYQNGSHVRTRYGRELRPGNAAGEAVAFQVFSLVEELLAIAAVAIIENRPDPEILLGGFEGGVTAPVIRVAGYGKKGLHEWDDLPDLIRLLEPLSPVLLRPQLVLL